MKDKLTALIIKFAFTFAAAWLAFGYVGGNPIGWVLITALAVTILNYFIGDLIVLPAFGNIIASIGDGLLGAITAFVISLLTGSVKPDNINNQIPNLFRTNLLTLVFFALIIMIAEYFFHKYLTQTSKVTYKKDNYK
jgi:flagellar biosynthesis component FlhA